ncbi:MAG: hypothetical protein LAT55_13195 [Opitutales bacterium]|nr:hypothetical protein [Opitutales bacterium]
MFWKFVDFFGIILSGLLLLPVLMAVFYLMFNGEILKAIMLLVVGGGGLVYFSYGLYKEYKKDESDESQQKLGNDPKT